MHISIAECCTHPPKKFWTCCAVKIDNLKCVMKREDGEMRMMMTTWPMSTLPSCSSAILAKTNWAGSWIEVTSGGVEVRAAVKASSD